MAKGDVIGRMACIACGHECKVKEDVNGAPYWVCGECGCRVQVGRDPEAIAAVKAKMKKAPAPAPAPAPSPESKPKEQVRDEF